MVGEGLKKQIISIKVMKFIAKG